jgi:hypothetical protein
MASKLAVVDGLSINTISKREFIGGTEFYFEKYVLKGIRNKLLKCRNKDLTCSISKIVHGKTF